MLNSAIETVAGITLWPLVTLVVKNANALVGVVTLAVNVAAMLATWWCISAAAAVARRSPESALSGIVIANSRFLEMAKFVTVVALVLQFFVFLQHEASILIVNKIGYATEIDFIHGVWAVVLGLVAPLSLLLLILVLGARMRQGTE